MEPIIDYDPLNNADQASELLEKVANGRMWELRKIGKAYDCQISEISAQSFSIAGTENLAKVLCALRASPEVTDAEINDAVGEIK